MFEQGGEALLPARIAVGLDLSQIGQGRPDMADRRHLVEAAGAVGAKPLVGDARAAGGVVDMDVGTHHQDQRTRRCRTPQSGNLRLRQHLADRRPPRGIVRLFAAAEIEEELHELTGRGVSTGLLRRSAIRKSQQPDQCKAQCAGAAHGRSSFR